jgi:hypothetical protein
MIKSVLRQVEYIDANIAKGDWIDDTPLPVENDFDDTPIKADNGIEHPVLGQNEFFKVVEILFDI